eukprot:m.34566 g.34566  ORF g.34566 m.34566 type:complete len:247 (-) comp16999_c0_seq1:665-1405(-)
MASNAMSDELRNRHTHSDVNKVATPSTSSSFSSDGTIAITCKTKAGSFQGFVDRVLNFNQITGILGVEDGVDITVVYKGNKISQGFTFPGSKCTIFVIVHSESPIVAPPSELDEDCPRFSWLPTPVQSVLGYASSFLPFSIVGGSSDRCDVDASGEVISRTKCSRGEIIPFCVDFTPDSATAIEVCVRWSAHGCGELLEDPVQVFEPNVGTNLKTTQRLRANGDAGTVVCTIIDDVSTATKTFVLE